MRLTLLFRKSAHDCEHDAAKQLVCVAMPGHQQDNLMHELC